MRAVNLIPDVDHGRLINFVARIVGSQDAEDVVQATYVKVLTSQALFRGECSMSSWVHRIAERTALDHLRRGRSRPEEPLRHRDGDGAWVTDAIAADLPCPLVAAEQQLYVRQLLAQIPSLYADALWAYIEHESGADAARALGISISALKSRVHRARTALRQLEVA